MQFIYVVRHGETDANVKRQVNDKNVITPLNAKGKKQATKTGKYLDKRCTKQNTVIYSSPAVRAMETATLIAKELRYDVSNIVIDKKMDELDHGKLSGLQKDDAVYKDFMKDRAKLLPTDPIDHELAYLKYDAFVHKKYNIESIQHAENRVNKFYKSLPKNVKHIIVVTHSGVIATSTRVLFNIFEPITGDITNGKNCTIMCITKDKKFKLLTLPNTLHLK